MSNKVTVVGFTGSGKTTYLAGMYVLMSAGSKNFSLVATNPNQDMYLESLWENLCEGKMPKPSDQSEKYEFHLAHNYKQVCDFEWLDYPGGILKEPAAAAYQELMANIKDSNCLLIVLDGKLFAIDADSEEDYEEKLSVQLRINPAVRQELKTLTLLSSSGVTVPPVALVITKCDLINPEYQAVIERVLRNSFGGIFEENAMVLTCAVSLGEGIEQGEPPQPHCIEQPIAFAVLVILLGYLYALSELKEQHQAVAEKQRGLWRSFWDADKVAEARQNLAEIRQMSDKWSKDAYKLIDLFSESKCIYSHGEKKNFRAHMREIFSQLGG